MQLYRGLVFSLLLANVFSIPRKYVGSGSDSGLYSSGFFEGDILLPNHDLLEKNAVADKSLLWPNGVVIYRVDLDVGCPSSRQCQILMKAINEYQQKTCIRFKEWTGEKDYVFVFYNTENDGACWSAVGRNGGEQRLSLGERCWYHGLVVHELGHAVGFWHEMNRPDRDSAIYIHWNNIIPNFKKAFEKRSSSTVDTLGDSFDLTSIMMYDEYAFSKDGRSPTIQPRNGKFIGPVWQKTGLSQQDVKRIKKLYCSGGTKRGHKQIDFPYDVKCEFNNDTCGFYNSAEEIWNWQNPNEQIKDGYVYTSFKRIGTTPGSFVSVNFHAVEESDRRGPIGCLQFWYLMYTDGGATLKVSQVHLDEATQINFDEDDTLDLWSSNESMEHWCPVQVPLYTNRPFKIIFESQFYKNNTFGSIALDDIELQYTQCSDLSLDNRNEKHKLISTNIISEEEGKINM